jgi:TPR repeat protein
MVQAHLGTDIIVNQIQSQPGDYTLNTTSLIKLKQSGVPDKVISAMQAKAAASAPTGASHSPNKPLPGNRPNTGNVPSPAVAAQARPPFPAPARQLTGQPGGAETFTQQTCPLLETDKILFLNFLRLEPRALDDEAILSRFVALNNQCERQYSDAQLGNELEYPQIAQSYKGKASEILSGVPSEMTLPASVIQFGPYDTAHGLFPLDTRSSMILRDLGTGSYTSGQTTVKIAPSSSLFPGDTKSVALIKLKYAPFVLHGLPMPESDAKQFLADLLQASEAGKAQLHADPFSVANASNEGNLVPNATRSLYVVAKIKILQTPPVITMQGEWAHDGIRKSGSVELAGQITEVSFLKQHPAEWNKNIPPVAVLHPDPAAGDIEQQAEAFIFKKQYSDAAPLAERSCNAGDPDGCALEGLLYTLGLGVTADLSRGVTLLHDGCEGILDAKACYLSALAYLKIGQVSLTSGRNRGNGLQSSFERSCEYGLSDGCFRLAASELNEATMSCRGLGNCPGQQKAWNRFDNACEAGMQQSSTECNGGDSFGCGNLALCYARGAGVSKDLAKAKQLYEQGCSLGDKEQCKEAQSHALSETAQARAQVTMTPEETAKINEMQAKCSNGNGEQCFQLALKYRNGKEVPQDIDMARKYFQASCDLGHRVGCIQAQLLH